MTFDDIIKEIGEFGPFQKRIYALICLPCLIVSSLLVLQVFMLGTPKHRCKLPDIENDTYSVVGSEHEKLINKWIPSDSTGEYDRCHLLNISADNTTQKVKCTQWVYYDDVFKATFTSKLNLVCDEAIKIPNVQSIFFSGVLVGSFVYGQISDIIGRRKTLYLSLLIQLASSLGLIGMFEYIGFAVLMFIMGGATLGVYMTVYVLGMELVGPSKRLWTGTINTLFLTTGQMYLVLMVYLIRDWKYFLLAVALPGCLFLPYYWLIPESCRWLLSKGRKDEAVEILKKVAKRNGTELNMKLVDTLETTTYNGRVWQLFSTRTLGIWSVIIFVNWFVCSMSYYGVVLNTANLGGSFYLNFVLLTVVEYPGKLLNMLLLDRLGRKRLYVAFLTIGGIACILTIWPIYYGTKDLHYVLITLAMLGKLCITGAFGAIYVLSAEIFPTVVRNSGMGASSAIARVGSMVAPYIAKSADLVSGVLGQVIPLTVFGVAMFIAGVLTLFLPETLNMALPETIEDVELLKRKVKKYEDDRLQSKTENTSKFEDNRMQAKTENTPKYEDICMEAKTENTPINEVISMEANTENTPKYEVMSMEAKTENTPKYEDMSMEANTENTPKYEDMSMEANTENTPKYEDMSMEANTENTPKYEDMSMEANTENTPKYEDMSMEAKTENTPKHEDMSMEAKTENTPKYEDISMEANHENIPTDDFEREPLYSYKF